MTMKPHEVGDMASPYGPGVVGEPHRNVVTGPPLDHAAVLGHHTDMGWLALADRIITEQQQKCLSGEHEADAVYIPNGAVAHPDYVRIEIACCRHCRCLYVEK